MAADIAGATQKVGPCVNDSFLNESRDHPTFPNRPTDRLTRSFAYGPIYGAYCDYQNQPGISFTSLKPGFMEALGTKAIHPACTLYELWVFVEIYDMLIRTFGFRLPANVVSDHPLDYVNAKAGEIVSDALKEHRFCLELRPSNNQQRVITVSLWYDTEESRRRIGASRLRPDVFLEITDSSSIGDLAKPFAFAIDAKYRKYPGYYYREERLRYGVDTVYDLDLLITAKEKYYQRLVCDAAFIVHSENNKTYQNWGGGPDKQNHWPGPKHHYGAVFATPFDTDNLRKLLKCFLMYHMDIENICWSCRNEIEPKPKYAEDRAGHIQYEDGIPIGFASIPGEKRLVGRNYICQSCSRSWERTWCSNPKANGEHRIFKIGLDNFHQKEDGHVICATCGDGAKEDAKTSSRKAQR